MKRRKRYHDSDDGNEVIQDGQSIHVPYLTDAGRYRHPARTALTDALRVYGTLGHKPMPVIDQLADTVTVHDCADLRRLFEARDRAFADLEQRSQNAWRRPFADAPPLNAKPPLPPEPAARYPDEGEDKDNNNGERDPADLEEAIKARDRAYLERGRLGDERWRTAGITDPAEADRVMRQSAQWRHGA
jgi:hypothetical protein